MRTLSYQFARLVSQGGLVILVGLLNYYLAKVIAWQYALGVLATMTLMTAIYHHCVLPSADSKKQSRHILRSFQQVIMRFVTLPNIMSSIGFLFIYNMAEAQLQRIVPLFLLDSASMGGLQMSITQVGLLCGGLGILSLCIGAVISGWILKKYSLERCLMPMTLLAVIANAGYLLLSAFEISNIIVIGVVVSIAQFAFGLSNSAYMANLLRLVAKQPYQMSLYAVGTSIMALGMMLSGAISGYLQNFLGYTSFFIWILLVGFGIYLYTRYVFYTQLSLTPVINRA